jgi:parallel beta-helix repeat protein
LLSFVGFFLGEFMKKVLAFSSITSAVLFQFLAPNALATTYTVSTSGNDTASGAGTASKPFKTITHAVGLAKAGDIVDVLPGTYRGEAIVYKNDGTSAAPITLQGSAAGVIVKGTEIVSGFVSAGNGVYCSSGWTHFFGTFDPAIISNPSLIYSDPFGYDARVKPTNQFFVDGEPLAQAVGSGDVLPNTFYTDKTDSKICFKPADGSINHVLEATATSTPLLSTAGHSYLVIQNMEFSQGATLSQQNGLVRVSGGTGHKIKNIQVTYAAGSGLSIAGTGINVSASVFNHNGQEGIASLATASTFSGNDTSYNNTLPGKSFSTGWEAGGNKFVRSDHLIVDHHLAHNNMGPGIWFDVANTNATISNSTVYENNFAGIQYEISWTGTIFNNLVYDTRQGPGINISSSGGCNVLNNTVYGNDAAGIQLIASIRNDGTTPTVGGKVVTRTDSAVSTTIKNNLVAENQQGNKYGPSMGITYVDLPSGAPALPVLTAPMVTVAYNTSDYNGYFLSAQHGTFFESTSATNQTTLSGWQKISGQDTHSIWVDPAFAYGDGSPLVYESGKFELASGNALAHRGENVSQVTTDFAGVKRPNPPTIGAYEASGSIMASANPVVVNFDATSATGVPASPFGAGCTSKVWNNIESSVPGTKFVGELSSTFEGCNATLGWETGPSALAFEASQETAVAVTNDTSTLLDFTNDSFTVNVWFKVPKGSTAQSILVAKDGSLGGWAMGVTNGRLSFFLKDTGSGFAAEATGPSVVEGTWMYASAVVQTSTSSSTGNDIQLYLNGTAEKQTLTRSGNPYSAPKVSGSDSAPLLLGARGTLKSQSLYMTGSLGDVSILSRGLSATEAQAACLATEYRYVLIPGMICSLPL